MATDGVLRFGEETGGCRLPQVSEDAAAAVADDRPLQRRLGRLKRCACTSRSFARSYLRAARALLRASRTDRMAPVDFANALLDGARETRRRAQKCLSFAGLCRRRALRLDSGSDSLFD